MNSTSYTYQPLLPGANCIRLLRLLPGEPAEKLQCELFNYQIRNNQTSCLYEALSYVWGDPTEKNDICIDSKQFAITSNLAAAFYRLRDPSLPRLLWVDAICINQADLEERENQVQFMSVIYSCASRVVVWLGEGCPQSNQACRLIIEAADASQRGPGGDSPHERDGNARAEETTRPGEENAIIALLRRPWFYRVWVLQEVAMARFTLLLCGDFQMTAHEFSSGLRQFRHEYDQEKTIVSTIESVVYLLEWQPRGGNLGSKLLPLSELIDIFHHRQATDIRDKVYALYGMSTDMMDTRSLQVNYQKPWSTLFKDLAQYSFGEKVHVTIVEETLSANIRGNGCALGRVVAINPHGAGGKQQVRVLSTHFRGASYIEQDSHPARLNWGATWVIQSSGNPIHIGDILCLLRGSKTPTLIRPSLKSLKFDIVLAAMRPPSTIYVDHSLSESRFSVDWGQFLKLITSFERRLNLVWNWSNDDSASCTPVAEHSNSSRGREAMTLQSEVAQGRLDSLVDMAGLMDDMDDGSGIGEVLRAFDSSFASTNLYSLPRKTLTGLQYINSLRHAYHNWSSYIQIKDYLETIFFAIYTTTRDRPHLFSFADFVERYERLGNIKFDLQDIISLGKHPRPMKLEGLLKPSKWNINEVRKQRLLLLLFPGYAKLPEAPLSMHGMNELYMQRLMVHCYGHLLSCSKSIIENAVRSETQGMFLLKIMADHYEAPPQFVAVLNDVVKNLDNEVIGPELAGFILPRAHNNIDLAYKILSKMAVAYQSMKDSAFIHVMTENARLILRYLEETDLCELATSNSDDQVITYLYHIYVLDRYYEHSQRSGYYAYFTRKFHASFVPDPRSPFRDVERDVNDLYLQYDKHQNVILDQQNSPAQHIKSVLIYVLRNYIKLQDSLSTGESAEGQDFFATYRTSETRLSDALPMEMNSIG